MKENVCTDIKVLSCPTILLHWFYVMKILKQDNWPAIQLKMYPGPFSYEAGVLAAMSALQ
jgi:hypothetical protein